MRQEILNKSKIVIRNKRVSILKILGGSMILAVLSQLAIPLPFSPVPITLQTFGVCILALTLGPIHSMLAVAAFLIEATIGLPVLAGGVSNPLWFIGCKAGYLFSFLLAAYLMGKLFESKIIFSTTLPKFLNVWFIFFIGTALILALGTLWLAAFVGFTNALIMGFLPFIPGSIIKITAAACVEKGWRK